jgi:hypothetical protein
VAERQHADGVGRSMQVDPSRTMRGGDFDHLLNRGVPRSR